MDPHSRRQVWSLLERSKSGRIILLTTHFMVGPTCEGDRPRDPHLLRVLIVCLHPVFVFSFSAAAVLSPC